MMEFSIAFALITILITGALIMSAISDFAATIGPQLDAIQADAARIAALVAAGTPPSAADQQTLADTTAKVSSAAAALAAIK